MAIEGSKRVGGGLARYEQWAFDVQAPSEDDAAMAVYEAITDYPGHLEAYGDPVVTPVEEAPGSMEDPHWTVTVRGFVPVPVANQLDKHLPYLSKANEVILARNALDADVADMALRTCGCGKQLDGFDAYTTHLAELFAGAN